ncbi:MAG: hypothetical protein E7356_01660 [Clostridiales bacterium]|nr:hypothetical protein [Clostridiales bacterium]
METKEEVIIEKEKPSKLKRSIKRIVLLFNLLVIAVYTTFSVISIMKDYGSVYTYILIGLVAFNIVLSLFIAIFNFAGKKKQARVLKDGKSIIAIFKKVLNLSNLVMGVISAIASFNIKDSSSVLSLVILIVSITLVVMQIMFAIFMFFIKKYIKRKARKVSARVRESAVAVKDKVKTSVESTKEKIADGVEVTKDKIKDGADAMKDKVKGGMSTIKSKLNKLISKDDDDTNSDAS